MVLSAESCLDHLSSIFEKPAENDRNHHVELNRPAPTTPFNVSIIQYAFQVYTGFLYTRWCFESIKKKETNDRYQCNMYLLARKNYPKMKPQNFAR